ncbi:MAG: class II fructose-1,6-bisphosphate aldolase [Nitrososphaerota archaeon]|nr:class II fructose-1,6-bisphosphate aldolase [Candidatus Bathyarchaeota archaeon]MDW8023356.1 class II fructose-1,6-bisphosphate aldolase [Nitrososphaerota archaeon]MDW8041104.1 class II fructose-1,6-bisphosphate aldolase [Nitrososphaerota archaeon]
MLAASRELLLAARREAYAVGAFNIQNLESLLAVVEAAFEERSPVIVAVTPSAIKYGGLRYLTALVKAAAENSPVPISLHLDHGEDVETVCKCLEAGFTSVMIDGSHLPFEDNIALTRRVVELAHPRGVSVEGELGRLAGVEEKAVEEREKVLTDPAEAEEFVKRTGVDALAVSIGTSHGAYKFKGEPKLDFERLRLIREKVEVPLVLHGASSVPQWVVEKATKYGAELTGAKGIPEDHIRKAISMGITKINIDTDLRLAFTATVREVLANSPKEFDPRKILGPAKEAMKEVVKAKMRLFGSSGKA